MSGVAIGAAAAVAVAGSQVYASRQQDKAQRRAAKAQERSAAEAKKQKEMEFNKANQKEVDVSGILGANGQGGTGTMITGPGGVDPNDLLLGGGSNLLGG